jgi:ribonuclease HI
MTSPGRDDDGHPVWIEGVNVPYEWDEPNYNGYTPKEYLMNKFQVWADGGSKGNGTPNQRGYGSYYVLAPTGATKREHYDFGNCTNNAAEWKILIRLLENIVIADALMSNAHVVVYMDSALVVNQYNEAWKTKSNDMRRFRDEALDLRDFLARRGVIIEVHTTPRDDIVAHLGH